MVLVLALDPRHDSNDPVKPLLAIALCTGAVDTTSIDRLISAALALADRTSKRSHTN